jgi:aspartate/methionine/tyrosine aminotransferase
VYDFGVGEMLPYFHLPSEIKEGTIDALNANETYYISPQACFVLFPAYPLLQGDPELLEALSRDFVNFKLHYTPEEICIVPGPKPGLFTALSLVLDPHATRNRVIIFSPWYESFEELPTFLTNQPTIVLETGDDW